MGDVFDSDLHDYIHEELHYTTFLSIYRKVYGLLFYSDGEEKVVGAITVGGILSCILSYVESAVGDGKKLRDVAVAHLREAVKPGT